MCKNGVLLSNGERASAGAGGEIGRSDGQMRAGRGAYGNVEACVRAGAGGKCGV